MVLHFKKYFVRLSAAVAFASAVAFPVSAVNAPSAAAITCGYHTDTDKIPGSGLEVSLPIFGDKNLFGGKQLTAFWGNCSDHNQKLAVQSGAGGKDICVTPGDTRLGAVSTGERISGAILVGDC